MSGFNLAITAVSLPMVLMVLIVIVGALRGRLTIVNPETHAWWCGIMTSAALLALIADRRVESQFWHAVDFGTFTFCLVLAIRSLGNVYLCRKFIAAREPEIPMELPEEQLTEWAFVRDGLVLQKVIIPESWGEPVRVPDIRPPFYLYVNGELRKKVG